MREALINIETVVAQGGSEDKTCINTEGTFSRTEDGWEFSYDDTAATGFDGSKTTFTVSENSLRMIRSGEYSAVLNIEKDRKIYSQYNIQGSSVRFGIDTKELSVALSESGGTVTVKYNMDIASDAYPGSSPLGDYTMLIKVRPIEGRKS